MAARDRRSRLRFRLVPSLVLMALIVVLPLAVYLWGRHSSVFAIKHVVVSGGQRVPASQAAALLRRRFDGANLLAVHATDVRKALPMYPYLRAVTISRDFPDTLRVRLLEYRPAICLLAGGHWYVIAAEGPAVADLGAASVAMPTPRASASSRAQSPAPTGVEASASPTPAPTGTAAPSGTTTVTGSGASSLLADLAQAVPAAARHPLLPAMAYDGPVAVGSSVDDANVEAALALVTALPGSLRSQVVALSAASPDALVMLLRGGVTVEMGDTSRIAAKAMALHAVLDRYRRSGVTPSRIDVTLPDRPLGSPLLPH
jgi:cell division septal protein FtsQ